MKKVLIIGLIILLLAFSIIWYFASPLFLNKIVDEKNPLNEVKDNIILTNESLNEPINDYLYLGNFIDADSFHKVKGKAIILEKDNKKYLRLENFEATNGPDLKVYLSEDTTVNSYVTLGELKGNIGDQNYELSSDIDLEKYDNVLIWCEKFSVLFGHAELK